MILLTVQNLRKHFGPEPVLNGVTFDVRPGERIGLVGPNGCGKTTLMKIIASLEEADAGKVEWHPSARGGLLEQHPKFDPALTTWDVASEGLAELKAIADDAERTAHDLAAADEPAEHKRLADRFDRLQHELEHRGGYQLDHQIERVLHGLGLPEACYTQPAVQLSGGQQNRLLLARLLLAENDLLLLDEPSNHLDLEATAWLESFLAATNKAFLVVSHDRFLLDRVTTRTLELFHGTVDSYAGNFSAYWGQKAERLEVQRRTYDKQREFIEKTQDFIRRNHYGQKHLQAEDRRKKLERLERVEPPREIVGPRFNFPPASRTGDIVIRAEHLAKAFDRPLFSNLSFDVLRGQRWGVLGPNASGKTTLLRCIVGQIEPTAGRVSLGAGVKAGYLDQLTGGLDLQKEVVEAIRPRGKEFTEPQRRDLLGSFGLSGDIVFQPVGSLSGGERSRAGLARLAAEDSNVLILDEPTNHLDLWAMDALEQAILRFDGTVLLVSHDRYFLNRVIDHLLVVEGDRFRVIEGNYDTYLNSLAARTADAPTSSFASDDSLSADKPKSGRQSSEAARAPKRKKKFPYRKAEEIEAEIHERESAICRLEHSLADPAVYTSGERVRDVHAQIAAHRAALPQLYEHWDEALELN